VASSFRCTIVTPAKAVFDGEVTYASIPCWDGQLGVMSGRSPLLARLGIGVLRLDVAGGASQRMVVDGGFAQINKGALTILSSRAMSAGEIDASGLEKEMAEANARAVSGTTNREAAESDQARVRAKRALVSAGTRAS